MITTKLSSGRVFLHNGDFSGDLQINVADDEAEMLSVPPDGDQMLRITVPFDDIKAIVAEYVRREAVRALEDCDDDVVLFGLTRTKT